MVEKFWKGQWGGDGGGGGGGQGRIQVLACLDLDLEHWQSALFQACFAV